MRRSSSSSSCDAFLLLLSVDKSIGFSGFSNAFLLSSTKSFGFFGFSILRAKSKEDKDSSFVVTRGRDGDNKGYVA